MKDQTTMDKVYAIMVLSDGDTWTTVSGCSICVINKQEFTDLCNGKIRPSDLKPLLEIGMLGHEEHCWDD